MFMMKIFLLMSMLFLSNSHPFFSIFIIMLMTLVITLFLSFYLKTSWMSLILILMMLGGMLIIFIYMASLSSNENFIFNKLYLSMFFILLIPIKMNKNYFFLLNLKELNNLFSSFSYFNSIISILFLLLTLFAIIEIIQPYKSPLRSS